MKIKLSYIVSILFVATISGCAHNTTPKQEEMYEKSAHLTKLTRKVQVAINANINNPEDLYTYVSQKFPETMAFFLDYTILMKNDNGFAVVLMCDKEQRKALLEDTVCEARVEGDNLYQSNLPCAFHLNIKSICK